MKKLLVLTAVFVLAFALQITAGPERVESKTVVQPITPAPECDWTGFYVGVQGGWRGNEADWDFADEDSNPEFHAENQFGLAFGGLALGYNRQLTRFFVIGVELSGSYGDADDTDARRDFGTDEIRYFRTENDWGGTLALRAGFTSLNNKLFLFAKGGAALTHWNYDYLNDQTLANSAQIPTFERWNEEETRISPLVGVGAEYAIGCHWTIKAEYNRVFLGEETLRNTLHRDDDPDTLNIEGDIPDHGFKIDQRSQDSAFLGLNYKF